MLWRIELIIGLLIRSSLFCMTIFCLLWKNRIKIFLLLTLESNFSYTICLCRMLIVVKFLIIYLKILYIIQWNVYGSNLLPFNWFRSIRVPFVTNLVLYVVPLISRLQDSLIHFSSCKLPLHDGELSNYSFIPESLLVAHAVSTWTSLVLHSNALQA